MVESNGIVDIYRDLLDEPDILSFVSKYMAYSYGGLKYDYGSTMIPKDTILYRIRQFETTVDYSDKRQWEPAPHKPQNRCNRKGETALYLGSSEELCLLETHTPINAKYVLGEYIVEKDIEVGGFTYVEPNESKWKQITGIILNAFLIAPSRNNANAELFKVLDTKFNDKDFSNIRLPDICSGNNMQLPFRIGAINQRDRYYGITNDLCALIRERYPLGIRYSSCYIPIETVGIKSNAYNIVLYENGINNVKWVKSDIKVNNCEVTPEGIADVLLNRVPNK